MGCHWLIYFPCVTSFIRLFQYCSIYCPNYTFLKTCSGIKFLHQLEKSTCIYVTAQDTLHHTFLPSSRVWNQECHNCLVCLLKYLKCCWQDFTTKMYWTAHWTKHSATCGWFQNSELNKTQTPKHVMKTKQIDLQFTVVVCKKSVN